MSGRRTALGAALWFVLAPVMLIGLVPWLLTGWRLGPPLSGLSADRWLGGVLLAAGVVALVDSFVRFVREGDGTPAPYELTKRLVITGAYRYVRNPTYVAVLSAVAGQALMFGAPSLLIAAASMAFCFHLYIVLVEEPRSGRDFGAAYDRYRRHVRR